MSKMLGHKDLRTTQHYAIVDRKISDGMNLLRVKLNEKDKKTFKAKKR